jgi:hypothetical protein
MKTATAARKRRKSIATVHGQLARVTSGRCRRCNAPNPIALVSQNCPECVFKMREQNRLRYRREKGIPLDAPLSPVGRCRLYI